ncbi:nucleotide-binding domain-containing protein [Carnobacterium maltaromaticum]|uniref:nucleotide-binding domain-containing protein n=1 Tax=Carnobacterium maltaromaticum TaxID=2751 RepID=UPI00295F3F4B|nr:nucleotidyltransferase [Carnobacterium maltaromaticum]
MYDCSKDFEKFYRTKVILSANEKNELRQKRKLNIKRLKDGLLEYNEEKKTTYKISEERIQGSMAMHTIVQNDENDYDIDIGIVFEAENLADLGPLATRNMVANALERKTKQFAEAPNVKTSCVRLEYISTGYHVDLAVFKRSMENILEDKYTYEHAGANWSVRHIKALEEWFNEEAKNKGIIFRKVVRLSKMFCKSRSSWKYMPSGLVQTILCDEKFATGYSRFDELFYYTMDAIVNRLEVYLEVKAPVDDGRLLTNREEDYVRMENWKNRLKSSLKELNILFEKECNYNDATTAWFNFFNHEYWENLGEHNLVENLNYNRLMEFDDTEEFIDDLFPIYEQYEVEIDCKVFGNGFSPMPISIYLERYAPIFQKFIPYNFSVTCNIKYTDCPSYDKVLWKVLNVGEEAQRRNNIRGQIKDRGKTIKETSNFMGSHYIECYLIRNETCVGIGHVNVPIGQG